VTGLSSSGPAFVYVMIEALSDGGVRMGLPRAVATHWPPRPCWARRKWCCRPASIPGVLKDQVASPGGTTIAGLHALERGGARAALMNAVEAASLRAAELGRALGAAGNEVVIYPLSPTPSAKPWSEQQRILIFDFGDQYNTVDRPPVREQNVYCQIVRHDLPAAASPSYGRPASSSPAARPACTRPAPRIATRPCSNLDIPILGICYGLQPGLSRPGRRGAGGAGPRVRPGGAARHPWPDPLLAGVPEETTVWMSHGDQVQSLNGDFIPLA